MPNVTMSIDETLLKKAKKFAVDQDSTISDLFRSFLTDLDGTVSRLCNRSRSTSLTGTFPVVLLGFADYCLCFFCQMPACLFRKYAKWRSL